MGIFSDTREEALEWDNQGLERKLEMAMKSLKRIRSILDNPYGDEDARVVERLRELFGMEEDR